MKIKADGKKNFISADSLFALYELKEGLLNIIISQLPPLIRTRVRNEVEKKFQEIVDKLNKSKSGVVKIGGVYISVNSKKGSSPILR